MGPVALTVSSSSSLSSGTGSWFRHCEFHFEMGFKESVLYNPATGLQALVCPRASTPQGLHFRSTACSKAGRRWTPLFSRDQTGPVSGRPEFQASCSSPEGDLCIPTFSAGFALRARAEDLFLKRISLGRFPCREGKRQDLCLEFPAWGTCEGATVPVPLKTWVTPSPAPFGALPASDGA